MNKLRLSFSVALFVVFSVVGSAVERSAGNQFFLDLGEGKKLDMIWIPAGSFLLATKGKATSEIKISEGFWMGRTEVTIAQWGQFAKMGYKSEAEKAGSAFTFSWQHTDWMKVKGKNWRDPGYEFAVKPEHPATCLSWNDALAFCAWLTKSDADSLPEGYEYRLPTELEWEYACRAGSDGTFWWGNDPAEGEGRENLCADDPLGHLFPDTSWPDKFSFSDGYAWASPVGVFGAKGRNAFGLSDMLGNIREWCLDSYSAAGPVSPVFKGKSDFKVLRGGDFQLSPKKVSCSHRSRDYPNSSSSFYGFRVVLGAAR